MMILSITLSTKTHNDKLLFVHKLIFIVNAYSFINVERVWGCYRLCNVSANIFRNQCKNRRKNKAYIHLELTFKPALWSSTVGVQWSFYTKRKLRWVKSSVKSSELTSDLKKNGFGYVYIQKNDIKLWLKFIDVCPWTYNTKLKNLFGMGWNSWWVVFASCFASQPHIYYWPHSQEEKLYWQHLNSPLFLHNFAH